MTEDEFLEQMVQCLQIQKMEIHIYKSSKRDTTNMLIKFQSLNERMIDMLIKRRKIVLKGIDDAV